MRRWPGCAEALRGRNPARIGPLDRHRRGSRPGIDRVRPRGDRRRYSTTTRSSPTPLPRRQLITDDVIAADRRLDVLGGSAGAILGLLRLYRQTGSEDVLMLAEKCGRGCCRTSASGRRVSGLGWRPASAGRSTVCRTERRVSHTAWHALAIATGNEEFASAADECIAFEELDIRRRPHGWADLRDKPMPAGRANGVTEHRASGWRGSAMTKLAGVPVESCATDIERALVGVERGWPATTDTLCCGTLGSIEFLREAGDVLGRRELRDRATRQLLDRRRNRASEQVITGGAAEQVDSISACSVASPASATRCCGASTTRCPTCWSGSER